MHRTNIILEYFPYISLNYLEPELELELYITLLQTIVGSETLNMEWKPVLEQAKQMAPHLLLKHTFSHLYREHVL